MLSRICRKIWVYLTIIYYKIKYKSHLKIKGKLTFRSGFKIIISKNAYLEIGAHCFFNNYCSINCLKSIKIGSDCIFGENVKIYDHNHVFNLKSLTRENSYTYGDITIGSNCWIGSNVTILKNARIGNNCVIGSGTIIDETIEDNTIVTMNRELKKEKIIRK